MKSYSLSSHVKYKYETTRDKVETQSLQKTTTQKFRHAFRVLAGNFRS